MRVRQLAKIIDLPPRDLLERIRRDLPRMPLDSVMSRLIEQDIDAIITALATERPRHDLAGTPYAEQAQVALQAYTRIRRFEERSNAERIERERAAQERAAAYVPRFTDTGIDAEQRFTTFTHLVDRLRQTGESTQRRDACDLLTLDAFSCRLSAEHGEFAAVMARRRLAMTHIGQVYRKFSWELLEDVSLLEFDGATHEALRHAKPEVIARLQRDVAILYPFDIDWEYASRYILNYIEQDAPDVKMDLTREQVRGQLESDDRLAEELATARGFGEIDDAQVARLEPWLAGEGEVDYPWLRALMDDDYLTYSAALAFEVRRAERVMIDTTLTHIFGDGDQAMSVRLDDEDENTRYRFMLYAGQGGVASVVVSFEL